jgi:hypothetical protein
MSYDDNNEVLEMDGKGGKGLEEEDSDVSENGEGKMGGVKFRK